MFSVIMPYYKNNNFVERSIRSVLDQTEKYFELIIMDDGSNDDVEKIVEEINDNRIRLYHQKNQGVSAARNNAIRKSLGEWTCFLDSDDEWFPDHLEEIKRLQTIYPGYGFYITSHKREGKKDYYSNSLLGFKENGAVIIDDLLEYSLKKPGIIHTNSVCISRKLIEKCGFFVEGVNSGEDTDLWYKCSLYTPVVVSTKVTSVYHRDNSYLTKIKAFNYHWVFLNSVQNFETDLSIPERKRYSAKLFCQKYQLSICKRLIAAGKKQDALKQYQQMGQKLCQELTAEYSKVRRLLLLPEWLSHAVLGLLYKIKERNY